MERNYLISEIEFEIKELEDQISYKKEVAKKIDSMIKSNLIPIRVLRKDGNEDIIAVDSGEDKYISIPTSEGTIECLILSAFEYNEEDYFAVIPYDRQNSQPVGEITLYRYKLNDGIDIFSIDDSEWEDIYNYYDSLFDETTII